MARAEYIEVVLNVRLHITDAGEGRPFVLIPGWPLSDEMYKHQYHDLINKNFCVSRYYMNVKSTKILFREVFTDLIGRLNGNRKMENEYFPIFYP